MTYRKTPNNFKRHCEICGEPIKSITYTARKPENKVLRCRKHLKVAENSSYENKVNNDE